jgi:long-chain acyl-CoA synthetase
LKQATDLGSGMENLNLIPPISEYNNYKLKLVGVFSKNREEWSVLDVANMLYNGCMVPLYDTLGPDSISYVLKHSNITTCFASEASILILQKA